MKRIIFTLLAICLMGTACEDKEPTGQIGSPDLQGTWKVKAISIEGVMTDIDSIREDFFNDALYPDIAVTIPDSAQGYIEGHTFYSMIEFDFEIIEQMQIRTFNYVEYVENELLIQFEQGVDAVQFAMNCTYKITPKRLLSDDLNIWFFETDGTEKLRVIISDLSQNENIKHIQFNHSGITPRGTVNHFQKNILNTVKFDISKDELKFWDLQDNPVIIFIKIS